MKGFASIKIKINQKLYLKDPEQTELGRNIIQNSILLIDELGFEAFTFKKLATHIHSTEASIYRYFENKHNLLVYLTSWYWSWLEYQIDYQIHNIEDPKRCIEIALSVITDINQQDDAFEYINEAALHRIVVAESLKTYHTKSVDEENKDDFFRSYKSLCNKLVELFEQVNPEYPFAKALSSTVIESAHQQIFLASHLPRLTDFSMHDSAQDYAPITQYLEHLVFTQLLSPLPEGCHLKKTD
ncbi:TetR/AcrR family transcriptional regulator [Eisenibacter elegans]|jgi:AcrR family transcriptional regulator|uniref:TetR/AcrR family transcriptional regulator n=1 Tax=Eisenibacter elegans TaxID=997 RepID=UPI000402A07B|nr:TetR/AcrR family transcriptional regulator [Eisenibacter elegans]